MSDRGRVPTHKPRWRRLALAMPAVALIGGGVAWVASTSSAGSTPAAPTAKTSPAIVVPKDAVTLPATPSWPDVYLAADPGADPGADAPGLVLPEGIVPGSSAPVTLDSTGIPVRALEAYRQAQSLIDAADPACHIDWALVAAIGRVESNHARFGGNHLDSNGVAQPGIIGIALDGSNGTARITDTDGGRLDRDTAYDRAVGPMQFIPGTWAVVGSDADGDGVKNPQDMADAATATAIYLCSGPGDLSIPGELRAAIMRYNASDSYVQTVTAIANAYRHGVKELPASDLPAAGRTASRSGVTSASGRPTTPTSGTSGTSGKSPTHPAPISKNQDPPAVASNAPPAGGSKPPATQAIPALPIPALHLPALPIPGVLPTAGIPQVTALTKQICTVNVLGVKICAIVPLGSIVPPGWTTTPPTPPTPKP